MLLFPFHPFPEIATQRLILRKIQLSDKINLQKLRSNPDVNKYTYGNVYNSIKDIEQFIRKTKRMLKENDCIYWAVTLKDNKDLIGTLCLFNFSFAEQKIEIGYELHPDFHRRGIISEALPVILEFGFKQMHAMAIEAFPNKENKASIHLLQQFKFERNYTTEKSIQFNNPNLLAYELSVYDFDEQFS